MTKNYYLSEKDFEKIKESNNLLSNSNFFSNSTNINSYLDNSSLNYTLQNNSIPYIPEKDNVSHNIYRPSKQILIF